MNPAGDSGSKSCAETSRDDLAGISDEVVADVGRRQSRQIDSEHRHELTVYVLTERADRHRGHGTQIALHLDVDVRGPFGLEEAALRERRKGPLRRQPDAIVPWR